MILGHFPSIISENLAHVERGGKLEVIVIIIVKGCFDTNYIITYSWFVAITIANGCAERSEDFLEKEGVVANHGWFES